MNYSFLLSPKRIWHGRLNNISDIDRMIFMNILPDRYRDKIRVLLKKYKDLDVIMTLPGSQDLKEAIRLTFYDTYLLSQPDIKGYSTHGYWVDSKKIYGLEGERGNEVDERLLEAGYEAIWVTRVPEDAAKYNRPASEWEFKDFPFKHEELEGVTAVNLTGAEHIQIMDDGDGGELWRRKKGFKSEKNVFSSEFLNRDDDYWGIETNPEGESTFSNGGYSGTQCTGFACVVSKTMPRRTKIYGFTEEDNPLSEIGRIAGGHDFAVIDDRYIVDPWLIEVESGRITTKSGTIIKLKGQGVFDLQDVADKHLIEMLYGSQENWKRMRGIETDNNNTNEKRTESSFIEEENINE
jgi:hypothetical protein